MIRATAAVLVLATAGPAPAQPLPEAVSCILTPARTVEVASPVEGVLAEVLVDRGDRVAEGAPLARLESSLQEAALAMARHEAASDAPVLSRRAQLTEARQRLAQTETLRARGVASETALNEVSAEVEVARNLLREAEVARETARLDANRAEAALALRTTRAPIAGAVLERHLDAGEYASEQRPLLTLVSLDPIHAEVLMPEKAFGRLQAGALAEVAMLGPDPATATGRIAVVDPVVDPASRTFGVRVALDNADGRLRAGLRCAVVFDAGERS